MDSKLSRWLNGLIEAGWLAAVIVAPLFFNIHSERVFEPDKLTLVRSIALIMSAAWLVLFIEQQGWKDLEWLRWRSEKSIWRTPFVLPIVALVLVYLISTAFSVAPRVSWAGSYQRLQGTYTTLSYVVIFALTAASIRQREQINRLVTTVIITSIPISLYGMIQHFGLDPLPWGGNVQRRIAGHMGNAIFIAAYLIMVAPLTLARIVDAFTNILNEEDFSYADVIRSSIYIFTFAIQLMAIYWSGSRGPWLGLLAGLFAFGLILLVSLRGAVADERRFQAADALRALALVVGGGILAYVILVLPAGALFEGAFGSFAAFVGALGVAALALIIMVAARHGWRWLWLSWILLAVVAVAWLALFNAPAVQAAEQVQTPVIGDVLETMSSWRQLPTIGRFGRILEADEGTGRVRVLIWQGALELVQPHEPLVFPDGSTDRWNFLRPLIGYGPETMYVAYNRFYQPELASIEARNASPDRSHNETFDALVITGALGFIVWQILYLSVFYYGFRWLGVVRSNRDRNLLIGLWIAGAAMAAVVITGVLGAPYIGVAIPVGSIAGLVVYLIYYSISGRVADEAAADPFGVDSLIMIGLLSAVLAHYVEIHFGIAIASTRVHFFVYVALMLLLGYLLPRRQEEEVAVVADSGRRVRRKRAPSTPGRAWTAPLLAGTYTLTLILGILGYQFLNYVLQGELRTIEDVPAVTEILNQALFINPSQNFANSPFIFLMIVLTWVLGVLLILSELAQQGILSYRDWGTGAWPAGATRLVAALFGVQALAALGVIFIALTGGSAAGLNTTGTLAVFLSAIWALLCVGAIVFVFTQRASAKRYVGIVALTGFLFSLPLLFTNVWYSLGILVASGVILYLVWDPELREALLPAGILAGISWVVGIGYVVLHAALVRRSFIGPTTPVSSEVQRQVLAADGFASLLTFFYVFAIGLMLFAAFALAGRERTPARSTGSAAGFGALAVLLILAFTLVGITNLRVIQADMVYKRARPLERIARQNRSVETWDYPIAIYEHAIDLAPLEDYYYLFLGAAYLEKSSVADDASVRVQLLEDARERLMRAQQINPLNTDHTANLARLTTRWAAFSADDPQRQSELVQTAENFYQRAMALSPQNALIRNEYANLLLTLGRDCPAALEAYEESLEIDPNYGITYLALGGAYQSCAEGQAEETRHAFLTRGAELIQSGAELQGQNEGAYLLQGATMLRQATEFDAAEQLLAEIRALGDPSAPAWQIDLEEARLERARGDLVQARTLAEQALAAAPADQQTTVQGFLDQLNTQGEE